MTPTTTPNRMRAVCAFLVATANAVALVPAQPAAAADCGGAIPCGCRDTVVADRTLDATDPVTTAPCSLVPGSAALFVDPGVTLNLGGRTITGSGNHTGVILGTGSKLVGPGTIEKFGRGVVGVTSADGIVITGVTASGNTGAGFDLLSDGNTLTGNLALGNGGDGIIISGTNNVVSSNLLRGNDGRGAFVRGSEFVGDDDEGDNVVKGNRAERNAGHGIEVFSNLVTLTGDNITSNKVKGAATGVTAAVGLKVGGTGHGINGNTVERYATGFEINGTVRKVSSNTAQDNGVGFLISGSDIGVVNGNRAFRNTAGDGVGYRVTGSRNFLKGNRAGSRNKGNLVGFDVSGSENRFESNRAELNVGNGFAVEGGKNTFKNDRAVSDGNVGFVVADAAPGSGNTLTGTRANRNLVCQYQIGENNVDGGGNRANGPVFSFDAAGGEFCPPPSGGSHGSGSRPPQAAIRATVDRRACAATCPVVLDGGRSSGLIATWTFSASTHPGGTEVLAPTSGASSMLAVDLAPGEYSVTLTVEGPTGSDTESRRITVRP